MPILTLVPAKSISLLMRSTISAKTETNINHIHIYLSKADVVMISGTATYTLYNVHENTISQGASLILTMVNLPVPTINDQVCYLIYGQLHHDVLIHISCQISYQSFFGIVCSHRYLSHLVFRSGPSIEIRTHSISCSIDN